ncbi:ligase-associated DNA damage response endonuclease PdeM [Sphingomonas sp.]|uniref:ligase-associated DNA damage response endonuclease PdeM n=1 Tax=Sphingomonas sp. TaxID=28214 RepID=UPI000DB15CA8|nr:ligase-associated DNA damage response endonuclease PdeM [Sphingomonas sp.]PZU12009.1 MAG: ligase-associated DNA damage response endonuclease PdeM [Sphingomonas sp.]
MVRFSFCGVELAALGSGALYWPARRALLVADLHFEKASWYARSGQMLPPYDTAATLAELEAIVASCAPAEIWCLGDSFHDAGGCARMAPSEQARLRTLTGALRWHWIVGNHDRGAADMADRCGGAVMAEALVDGLLLTHEADPAEKRPELSGHFHPKLRLTLRGRHVARRCFVASETKLILPAFGALTGGMDAHDPVIRRAVGGGRAQALVPLADRMLRFPLAAGKPPPLAGREESDQPFTSTGFSRHIWG